MFLVLYLAALDINGAITSLKNYAIAGLTLVLAYLLITHLAQKRVLGIILGIVAAGVVWAALTTPLVQDAGQTITGLFGVS